MVELTLWPLRLLMILLNACLRLLIYLSESPTCVLVRLGVLFHEQLEREFEQLTGAAKAYEATKSPHRLATVSPAWPGRTHDQAAESRVLLHKGGSQGTFKSVISAL